MFYLCTLNSGDGQHWVCEAAAPQHRMPYEMARAMLRSSERLSAVLACVEADGALQVRFSATKSVGLGLFIADHEYTEIKSAVEAYASNSRSPEAQAVASRKK